jgi:transcriptional regulator with XRE-family HTH domain
MAFSPLQDDSGAVEKLDLRPMGRRIRIERARLDLTQQELANASGVQQKTIAQIERGRQHGLSVYTLSALADALDNLSLDYLLYGQAERRKGSEE